MGDLSLVANPCQLKSSQDVSPPTLITVFSLYKMTAWSRVESRQLGFGLEFRLISNLT